MSSQSTLPAFGFRDADWNDAEWHALLEKLIGGGFFSWKDVATVALGQANPPQVGTSIASNEGFQRNHHDPEGPSVMQQVYAWLYEQPGRCVECGTRIDLQADHVNPRQDAIDDPAEVDRLDNLVLRCRRHNVIRRRSHKLGGKTHLTAEVALMWILLVLRPRTLLDFIRMCRLYGMAMADVRMREGWAMATWLEREDAYEIEQGTTTNALILWPEDGALTRRWVTDAPAPGEPEPLVETTSDARVSFIIRPDPARYERLQLWSRTVSDLPFSVYDLSPRRPYALAVKSQQPKADEMGDLVELDSMPPRHAELLELKVHPESTRAVVTFRSARGLHREVTVGRSGCKSFDIPAKTMVRSNGHPDVVLQTVDR